MFLHLHHEQFSDHTRTLSGCLDDGQTLLRLEGRGIPVGEIADCRVNSQIVPRLWLGEGFRVVPELSPMRFGVPNLYWSRN